MNWLNYKGISKDIIESVEHRLQITLPDDYKQVALKYDGGYANPNHFKVGEKLEIFNNLISLCLKLLTVKFLNYCFRWLKVSRRLFR